MIHRGWSEHHVFARACADPVADDRAAADRASMPDVAGYGACGARLDLATWIPPQEVSMHPVSHRALAALSLATLTSLSACLDLDGGDADTGTVGLNLVGQSSSGATFRL